MLFTSQEFVVLLTITFLLYYVPFLKKLQVAILIASSFVFYAYFQPALLLLLIFSIIINASASYFIYLKNTIHSKKIAIAGVVTNLALLCFFKYSPLVADVFFRSDNSIRHFLITLPLPIGISFFTFEGITLLVDTYTGQVEQNKKKVIIAGSPLKHIGNVAFFISFFPHLISGPILKAYEFFPQIKTKKFTEIPWQNAVKMLITGYFLKMVIADNLKEQTNYLSYPGFLSAPTSSLVIQVFGYSMQIFADFAGYSLIALGLAALFGYTLNQNFNYPYISTSFAEFWRRWHISLSTFLREYLYFPLGGNRKGKWRTYLNLLIVMGLGGLWHGAAWKYAVWGLAHGLALVVERMFKDTVKIKQNRLINFIGGCLVFVYVSLAWLLFKLHNFKHVVLYFKTFAANSHIPISFFFQRVNIYNLLYALPVVLYHVYYLFKRKYTNSPALKYEFLLYGVMLFFIVTNSGLSGDFIYFQF